MEAHEGVLDCHFSWMLLDKPCNICFLPWVGKVINIDLFRRKSLGCLTRVVHKSSWANLKPRHTTPQKEINIGKNTTSSSQMKIIFYSPNTTHEWFRFKKRFEVSKIAVAGHGTRYLLRLTFSRPHYIDLRDNAFPVFVRQTD